MHLRQSLAFSCLHPSPGLFLIIHSATGLSILTFLFGFCLEFFFAVSWIIFYDWFPAGVASQVNGYFHSVGGVAILACAVVRSLIAESDTTGRAQKMSTITNSSSVFVHESIRSDLSLTQSSSYNQSLATTAPSFTTELASMSRSWSNRAIVIFSCCFLIASLIIKIVLFLMKSRQSAGANEIKKK